ncbi:hypothetical protein [Halomarina rubra]|uniref:DoxX-like protein n=1 Tax=Halomarina rubra TaxID=2071873 RepID=A0ABD6ASH9_9EURY|nr:hypothetical protein [Halomarina rubra]
MSRVLGGLVGVAMVLFPAKLTVLMQELAIENPDSFTERRWLTPYVRAEGVLITLVCLVGGRPYEAFMKFIGSVGAVLLCFPRQYVEFGNRVGYDGSDPFEWKKNYLPGLRVLGAFLLVLAFRALRRPDGTE